MLRNGLPVSLASLAPRLERVLSRLIPSEAAPRPDLTGIRRDLSDLGAELADRPGPRDALHRLGLLAEVWDCLPAESAEDQSAMAMLFDESIRRLLEDFASERSQETTAVWLRGESSGRWGRYLDLLDNPAPTKVRPSLAESDEDDPAAGWQEIANLFGIAPPSQVPTPAVELPRPAPELSAPQPIGAPREHDDFSMFSPDSESYDPEILDAFRADAEDLTGRIEVLASEIERSGCRAEAMGEVGRCLHTLKGAAGAVGLFALVGQVHDLEGFCERASDGQGAGPPGFLDGLHELLSQVGTVLGRIRSAQSAGEEAPDLPAGLPSPGPVAEGLATIEGADEGDGMIRVPRGRIDQLLDLVAELLILNGPRGSGSGRSKALAAAARTCRNRLLVSIDHLGELSPDLVGVGEGGDSRRPLENVLAIVQDLSEQCDDLAFLAESARAAADPLADEADATSRVSHQLWDLVHDIRIAPVRPLFQRLEHVARGAARVEGRQVDVATVGEDLELDRALQDRVFEPLMHVVRNAVGHGIEPPEARVLAGKPPEGRITLEAGRRENALWLTIRDDGRGIDDAEVEARGRLLGLIGPDEKPAPEAIRALLFRPGFSTSRAVGPISGRGIGMDVVAREVARLHGVISLTSEPGRGTALTIHLPARISLVQALIVRIDGQAFGLPLGSVELGQSPEGPTRPATGAIDARAALGLPPFGPSEPSRVVMLRPGGESRALTVDSIDGTRELVAKPLNPLIGGHPAISGTSLSIDGELVLMLDPDGLVRRGDPADALPPQARHQGRKTLVLLVDDSISVRRATARHLRALGLEVEEAFDGVEALRKIRDRPYGLILTDLEMPRMDGFELLAELGGSGHPAPVVVSSTRSDPETRRRVRGLGATAFIAKPARYEDLAEVLGPLLLAARG